jgi:hypothetical protein
MSNGSNVQGRQLGFADYQKSRRFILPSLPALSAKPVFKLGATELSGSPIQSPQRPRVDCGPKEPEC